MSLLITIFGGMLLTAVLYAAGRLGRLSNYWAAVLAAAIPTVAYLIHAIGHPVGLDTVTLHVIAYPTVAVLLGMINSEKARRQHNAHWAPRLLVAFFLVVVTMMAGFVYIAGQGLPPALAQMLLPNAQGKNIHTGFAGVVEHHQGAAKGIGQHLKMEDRLARLGWQVEVAGLAGLAAGNPAAVTVRVEEGDARPVAGVTARLEIERPGQNERQQLALADGGDGHRGVLPGLAAGTWIARLHLTRDQDAIVLEHGFEVR
ncbi:MAG: FixH family protein [Gallionellaceae bacterium]|nr:FixH family protein [Gallionellaceae bacterium]